jgi:hypothetical protein
MNQVGAWQNAYRCLRKMDHPKNWTIRVWENLGWHWAVETKFVSISASGGRNPYMAMMKPHYSCIGSAPHGKNPNKLADEVIKLAESYAREMTHLAEDARRSISARK